MNFNEFVNEVKDNIKLFLPIVVWSIGRGFSINVLCGNSISFPKILFSCKTSFGKITISPEQAVSDQHNSPFVGTHISVIFFLFFRYSNNIPQMQCSAIYTHINKTPPFL